MQDIDAVREAFTDPEEFWSSPLHRRLSAVVAADPFLVDLAAHAHAGQGPTFAFFRAVLVAFAHRHADELTAVLAVRLVQTHQVQRAVGLRLGLSAVAPEVRGRPVHLLEVGSSAVLLARRLRRARGSVRRRGCRSAATSRAGPSSCRRRRGAG